MDRHPQQLKRERQDKKRRTRNVDSLSRLRTHIKKVLASNSKNDAEILYRHTVQIIEKITHMIRVVCFVS